MNAVALRIPIKDVINLDKDSGSIPADAQAKKVYLEDGELVLELESNEIQTPYDFPMVFAEYQSWIAKTTKREPAKPKKAVESKQEKQP